VWAITARPITPCDDQRKGKKQRVRTSTTTKNKAKISWNIRPPENIRNGKQTIKSTPAVVTFSSGESPKQGVPRGWEPETLKKVKNPVECTRQKYCSRDSRQIHRKQDPRLPKQPDPQVAEGEKSDFSKRFTDKIFTPLIPTKQSRPP